MGGFNFPMMGGPQQIYPEVTAAMERMRGGGGGFDQAQAMMRGPQQMGWGQGLRPQGNIPQMQEGMRQLRQPAQISPMLQRGAQIGGWARPEGMMGGRMAGMQQRLQGLQAPPQADAGWMRRAYGMRHQGPQVV